VSVTKHGKATFEGFKENWFAIIIALLLFVQYTKFMQRFQCSWVVGAEFDLSSVKGFGQEFFCFLIEFLFPAQSAKSIDYLQRHHICLSIEPALSLECRDQESLSLIVSIQSNI